MTAPSDLPASSPQLPLRVRVLIGAAGVADAGCLVVIALQRHRITGMTSHQWAVMAAAVLLATLGAVRPLLLFRGGESEAFTFSEAFLVILMLTVPPVCALAGILTVAVAAQIVKRRPLSKAVFNVGQMGAAAAAAIALTHLISPPPDRFQIGNVAAATVGAAAFFVINNTAVAAVLTAIGSTWRSCLIDGIRLRLALSSSGVVAGAVLGVSLHGGSWPLILAVPTLLLVRYTMAAQFRSEHDRARAIGLLDATLEAYRTLETREVTETIVRSARSLLRSPDSQISFVRPEAATAVPITSDGRPQWLVAAGRRKEEPFEDSDLALLRSLAAVGSGAATNAELYRQVRYERQRLASVALSIGEGVVAVDSDGNLTFANTAAGDIIDLPVLTAVGDGGLSEDFQVAPGFLLGPALRCMSEGRPVGDDNAVFPGRGGPVPVAYLASPIMEQGEPAGAVIAFHDMSERKGLEERLRHQGRHDSLTGLANRRQLVERLESLLREPERPGRTHAVMFVDVDRFKGVNDSLGHAVGDDLLVAVGRRLQAAARDVDLVARFGGDEFVALLADVEGQDHAAALARRMCKAVEQPILLSDGYEFVATVSAGIALSGGGQSADDLLHNADVAMYDAKVHRHGGAVQFFDRSSMGSRSAVLVQLEADLRRAVERGEIEVHYQPRFTIADGDIVGAEALVRWHHPKLGVLGPSSFIDLAEETGLIVPVGHAVLQQAARFAKEVGQAAGRPLPVSVNLSPRQFRHSGLVIDLRRVLRDSGLDAPCLTVEITESMVMEDLADARHLMSQLRSIGVNIAIDDFGTGHSSLGYLKRFPVQELKIDRTFVAGVADHRTDRAIVRAVIQLAEAMDVIPVAEGVETEAQLTELRSLRCPLAQGYYVSPALDAESFTRLVTEPPPRPHRNTPSGIVV